LHRLAALPIRVPPLRARPADIPVLCELFLRQLGDGRCALTAAAMAKLRTHAFPGNVRELRNLLLQAVVFVGKPVLDAGDLRFAHVALAEKVAEARAYAPGKTLADIEGEVLDYAVELHGSHVAAARALGISRSTLIARMKARRERAARAGKARA
jgi:DNA-binding NtrC family response regulator